MIPGSSQILICPHCGGEKQVMSLLSGNTYGAELWSDNKQIAPMLPEVSLVQKCPHCGKYYFKSRQEVRYATDAYSSEQGLLTFTEMKEAFIQLSDEGFRDNLEEINLRMMLFHSFNDFYYRSGSGAEVTPDDFEIFVEQGRWLVDNCLEEPLLKAEFLREIGDFEKANEILVSISDMDEYLRNISSAILYRIRNKDKRVFRIQ